MKRTQNQDNEAGEVVSHAAIEGEAVERLTPAGWADRKGIAPKGDALRPWVEPIAKSTKGCPNGVHLHAADVLHGWSHHAYNYQAEGDRLLLSEEDFDAALEAAAHYPARNAHMPAVAKSAPFRKELEARAAAEALAKAEAEKAKEQAQ